MSHGHAMRLKRLLSGRTVTDFAFGASTSSNSMAPPVPPLEDISITCRQFKCFSDAPYGFDKIKPVNVIIGRNNSGKSTLLDLIDFATRPSAAMLDDRRHRGQPPQIFLSWPLTQQYI